MTQLLQEMIELHKDRMLSEHIELLLEYLGNLSVIDKGLIRSLTKAAAMSYGSTAKKAPKLAKTVGQQSKVEKKVATGKNGDQLWKHFDENKDIVAIVLDYDGKQIMAISDKSRTMADPNDPHFSGYKEPSKAMMYTVAQDDFFTTIMSEEEFDKTFASSYESKTWRDGAGGKSRELKSGATQARTFVRKLLDVSVKKAREEKKEVTVLYIYKDAERVKTQDDRKTARAGQVPTPKDDQTPSGRRSGGGVYTEYIKDMKSVLAQRLDKFKASKAKSFTTVEEMLTYIKDEGYLDKIKVGDYDYEMKDARMYFEDMLKSSRGKSDNWRNDSYVEYRLRDSIWDLRKTIRKEVMAANPGKEMEELETELEAAYKEKVPPAKLKVIYGLKGGLIVPQEVKALDE